MADLSGTVLHHEGSDQSTIAHGTGPDGSIAATGGTDNRSVAAGSNPDNTDGNDSTLNDQPGFPVYTPIAATVSSQGLAQEETDAPLSGAFTIAGSTTIQPVSQLLAQAFMQNNSGVTISVIGGGSGAGETEVGKGLVDIGAASENVPASIMQMYPGIVTTRIGASAVVVIVNVQDNVNSISKTDLTALYDNISGNKPAEFSGFTVYTRAESSGTADTFSAWLLGNKSGIYYSAETVGETGDPGVVSSVASAPNSIGYCEYYHAVNNPNVKIIGIVDGNTTYAAPSRDALLQVIKGMNASLYPLTLTRPLNYLTNGQPNPLVQAFIDYVTSPQAVWAFTENGFFSIQELSVPAPTTSSSHDVPVEQISFPAQSGMPGHDQTGGISGRVTTYNTIVGLANASVYIVNPDNTSQFYWHGYTDGQGCFQLSGVNNTWSDATDTYLLSYKAYCYDSESVEGYSDNFSVAAGSTEAVSIAVSPIPAHVNVTTERDSVTTDGADSVGVSACVTDVRGHPVPDGTAVVFTINPGQTYTTDMGQWFGSSNATVTALTSNGVASATFGRVPDTSIGGSSMLAAACTNNPGVNGTVRINFVAPCQSPTQQISAPVMQGPQCAGSILGRVTTADSTVGIANADIYVVSSNDPDRFYYRTVTNAQGYFFLTGVNSTFNMTSGSCGFDYKVYAYDSVYGGGCSNNFSVEPDSTADADVILGEGSGGVSGRVTTSNSTVGIASAYVAIVNASNPDQVYYASATNAQGFYQFTDIGSTYDPASGKYVSNYKVYAYDSVYGGGCSNNFSVEPDSTADADVILGEGSGGVSGRVTTSGSSVGIANVYVAIVNASNTSQVCYAGATNAQGFYQFTDIGSTYDPASGKCEASYKLYANGSSFGTGYSGNITVETGSTAIADAIIFPPQPDAIAICANPCTILTGGDTAIITAQLYLNGAPYHLSGVPIGFVSDNDKVACLPIIVYNVTDSDGQATIVLTSNATQGIVNVTAFSQIRVTTNLTSTCQVRTSNWGTIGGVVADNDGNEVPGATVELWEIDPNSIVSGAYIKTTLYPAPENPQQSVSRSQVAPVGSFAFYKIPAGQYIVSWISGSQSGEQPVTVSQGTSTVLFNVNKTLLFPGYTDAPAGHTTLYGIVLDKNKNAVPLANVTLYDTAYNRSTDSWDSLSQVTKTQTGSYPGDGLYKFSNVSYGTYKIIADKRDVTGTGHSYYAIVTLNGSGCCAFIVMPDLVVSTSSPATQSPSLDLYAPAVEDNYVYVNGVTAPGAAGTYVTRVHWDWGDGSSDDHWFPDMHVYARTGNYTINVTSYQSDGRSTTKTLQDDVSQVSYGTIHGRVLDTNGNDVAGAAVTLWTTRLNGSRYDNVAWFAGPGNPQYVSGSEYSYGVPAGTYNVTAEYTDRSGNHYAGCALVNVTPGADIASSILLPGFAPYHIVLWSNTSSDILLGGNPVLVTAQIEDGNWNPLKMAGVNVTFSSDNDSVATLPAVRTVVTDSSGQATLVLTSGNLEGTVNVTAINADDSQWYTGSMQVMVYSQDDVPYYLSLHTSASFNALLLGGSQMMITAQVMDWKWNNVPLAGVNVTFSSDNDSVATLPAVRTVVTDSSGQATLVLTSGNMEGVVNVTAVSANNSRWLSGGIQIDVYATNDTPLNIEFNYSAYPAAPLHPGGDARLLVVQLYDLNNRPVKKAGVAVTFYSDNDSVAVLPAVKTVVTDSSGQARILLTPGRTEGVVDVTASLASPPWYMTRTQVMSYYGGNISGMVRDGSGNGVRAVYVSALNTNTFNGSSWSNCTAYDPGAGPAGSFSFSDLPAGTYNVSVLVTNYVPAAANNLSSLGIAAYACSTIVNVERSGTATAEIVLPDHVDPYVFRLMPATAEGWNLVSIPINITFNASDVVGGNVIDAAAVFNQSAGMYTVYYQGASAWKNFTVMPGTSVFIHQAGAVGVTSGSTFGPLITAHNISIHAGWNMLGWSDWKSINASALLSSVPGAAMVARYNNTAGLFRAYYIGAGQDKDFTITSGEGFFLLSDSDTTQQLHVEG